MVRGRDIAALGYIIPTPCELRVLDLRENLAHYSSPETSDSSIYSELYMVNVSIVS
jgi:hypothetical protein